MSTTDLTTGQLVLALSSLELEIRTLAAKMTRLEYDPLMIADLEDAQRALAKVKLLIDPPPRRSKP